MTVPLHVLLLSKQAEDGVHISEALRRAGFAPEVRQVGAEADLVAGLLDNPKVVLARNEPVGLPMRQVLPLLHAYAAHIPLIIVDDETHGETVARWIADGAAGYVCLDRLDGLASAIHEALTGSSPFQSRRRASLIRQSHVFYRIALLPALRIEHISPAILPLTGYSPEAFSTDPGLLESLIHPDDKPLLDHLEQGTLNPPATIRMLHRDGHLIWTEHFRDVIRDEADVPCAIEGVIHDITPLKQAEETLRRSEASFRAAAESSLDAFYILSSVRDDSDRIVDFTLTYVNARTEAQFRLPRASLIGQRLCDLLPFAREGGFLERYIRVIESVQAYEGEHFIPDGERMAGWHYQQVVPLNDGVAVTNRDITARKQMEGLLQRSGNIFRWFIAHATDGMMLADEQGALIAWNEAQEQVTGLSRDEVIGQRVWDVVARLTPNVVDTPGAVEHLRERFRDVLRSGEAEWLGRLTETTIQRPDGGMRHVQEAYFPIRTDRGYMIGNVIRDFSERRHIEDALRATVADLRAMLNNTLQSFVLIDAQGTIQAFNRIAGERSRALLGRELRPGDPIEVMARPEDRERLSEYLADALEGRSVQYETRFDGPEGDTRWFRFDFTPVLTDDAQVIGICISAMDITDQRQAETQALDLLLERERLRVLESFISDASHDFNTPISILKTTSYLLSKLSDQLFKQTIRLSGQIFSITPETLSAVLRDIGEIAISIQKQVSSLESSSQRLENLVGSLLEITRLEYQPHFKFALRNLNMLADDVIDMHRPLASERQISLHFQADDSIPLVAVDEDQFRRLLQNLLENAIHYTLPGGHVFVKTYARPDQVVIEVTDTGIGIASSDLPHIFERFYRADKARQANTGGAGLGLTIAQRIVEGHVGKIEVHSTVGEGSTFRVILLINHD